MYSILFLIGAQRSCTTLLAKMLAPHPAILLTIEGKLLYYLITWVARDPFINPGAHLRLDEIAHSITRRPVTGISELEQHRMRRALLTRFRPSRFRTMDRREIIRTIWCGVYEEIKGNRVVIGDKYNEYLLQLPEIIGLFPEARFIFLHRNPVDAAESMMRSFKDRPWAVETPEDGLRKWAQWNGEWLRWRSTVPPAHRLEIAATCLFSKPEETMRSIGDFLRVEFAPKYLSEVAGWIQPDRAGRGQGLVVDWISVQEQAPYFWTVSNALGYRHERVKMPTASLSAS
jgi:hypothetical protein